MITRGVRKFPTNVVFARSSRSYPRRTPTSERLSVEDFSHRFSSAVWEQERMSASIFHVCSHRAGNYMRLFVRTVLLLSIDSTHLTSSQR